MKSFLTVLNFELMHYFKNKVFIISTVILIVLVSVGLSIPTIVEVFDSENIGDITDSDKISVYGLYDPSNVIKDITAFNEMFSIGNLVVAERLEELNDKVLSGEFDGGFHIKSNIEYDYVVLNNEMMDSGLSAFKYPFNRVYQKKSFEAKGINFDEVLSIIEPQIIYNIEVLGKDSAANYAYTYILLFGLYMIIMMYGQLIATAVASEKSNRTMELLVTSTKSSNLIFGKVIGGAVASVLQFSAILGIAKIVYYLNGNAWNGKLDFVFSIPIEVILNFAVFGILGYLFYAFIYGALGALVSKTEDVNTSSMPITLVFVAVFFVSFTGMQNTESMLLKIASFLPFSSFMAMFIRVSMGEVAWYEIAISLILLITTTGVIGWFAAKIYRMGTLMYGNPVKIKDIPKILKSQ